MRAFAVPVPPGPESGDGQLAPGEPAVAHTQARRSRTLRAALVRSVRRDWDLWGAAAPATVLAANNAIAPNLATALSVVLGLLLGLVAPGYVLIALLQTRRGDLDELERWGLSLVLSVVVVIISALLLSEVHIRLDASRVTTALAAETVILAGASAYRRSTLAPTERYVPPLPRGRWPYLTLLLAVGLGVTTWQVASAGYRSVTPGFSITSPSGKLSGYPFEVRIGRDSPLTLHVDNPTSQAVSYRLVISAGGTKTESQRVTVGTGGTWSERVDLPANAPARDEIVRFTLYQGTRARRMLWIRYRIVR